MPKKMIKRGTETSEKPHLTETELQTLFRRIRRINSKDAKGIVFVGEDVRRKDGVYLEGKNFTCGYSRMEAALQIVSAISE